MSWFGGKRLEKLRIGWNWLFQVNMSHFLEGNLGKVENWPKLALLSQFEPLWWQNWPLWVILSHSSWKWFKNCKSGKIELMYPPSQNWQKLKYLSRISTDLYEIIITGLIFPSRSKWVQGVLCYDQNWQKLKYLSRNSTYLYETFITGLVFLSQLKWVQGVLCYNQNWQKLKYPSRNSTDLYETFIMACFSKMVIKSARSVMLWSKLTKS